MRRYSFKDIIVLVNGLEITGWASGDDSIKVSRREDSASDEVGAGGDMMVSISANRSGEFTFKLQQTSSSNKMLLALMTQQEDIKDWVPITVSTKDSYRNDIATGLQGYIKKPAEMQRGEKGQNQEWAIVVERLDLMFGDTK
jgi:hypothetical protein